MHPLHRVQVRLEEVFVILWVIFNKVSVDTESLVTTVFFQKVQQMLIATESFRIYKCHEIDISWIKFPGNKTSVDPLMKIRANDGNQLLHIHRKVLENYLPRARSGKSIHKLSFKCRPVSINNVVGLQVALNVKLQVCAVLLVIKDTKIKLLNILPQHFQRRAGQDAAAVEQTDYYG